MYVDQITQVINDLAASKIDQAEALRRATNLSLMGLYQGQMLDNETGIGWTVSAEDIETIAERRGKTLVDGALETVVYEAFETLSDWEDQLHIVMDDRDLYVDDPETEVNTDGA